MSSESVVTITRSTDSAISPARTLYARSGNPQSSARFLSGMPLDPLRAGTRATTPSTSGGKLSAPLADEGDVVGGAVLDQPRLVLIVDDGQPFVDLGHERPA